MQNLSNFGLQNFTEEDMEKQRKIAAMAMGKSEAEHRMEELAKRRVYLEATLTSIGYMNVNGKTLEQLTEMEVSRIKAQKELNSVKQQIKSYEESK